MTMTLEKKISKIFRLDTDEAWLKHANHWSAYSRFSMLPLLAISFWSRVWLGWWALVPIIIVLLWLWLNPTIFSRAKSTNNWASKHIKPYTYEVKASLPEHINIKIIFYRKIDDGIEVDYGEIL